VDGQTEAVTFADSLHAVNRPIKQSGALKAALSIEIQREQQSEKSGSRRIKRGKRFREAFASTAMQGAVNRPGPASILSR